MKLHKIWQNYSFWFKLSLIMVFFWFIFSLSISLVIYFSWPYNVIGIEAIIFKFLTWFFVLPSVALLGIVNAIPFMATWLFEDIEDDASPFLPNQRVVRQGGNAVNNQNNQQPVKKTQSYKDVSSRLMEEKEPAQKIEDLLTDIEDYDDF